MSLRAIVVLALSIAIVFANARTAFADALPAALLEANHRLEMATSFRLIETVGSKAIEVSFIRPDRESVDLRPQKIIRVGNNVWAQVPPVGAWQLVANAGPGKLANFVKIGLPNSPTVHVLADASDGTSPAHVYSIEYPDIHVTLTWFVRIADGKLHMITGPSDQPGVEQVITIDRYDAVAPIDPPKLP